MSYFRTSGGYYVYNPQPTGSAPNAPVTTKPEIVTSKGQITARLPSSEMGDIIPYIGGKRIVNGKVAWAGNQKTIRKTKTEVVPEVTSVQNEDGTVTTTTKETTTKTNYVEGITCDVQLLLGLGPNLKLRRIFSDQEIIWEGDIGPARTVIGPLPVSNTGMSGTTVIFSGGSFSQLPETEMNSLVPNNPGYPGMGYVYIKNFRADKYTSGLSFEVQRIPQFPVDINIPLENENNDINPVILIGDIITNPWGGAGVDIADLDVGLVSRFSDAEATISSEGIFASVIIDTDTTAVAVLQELCKIVDGVLFQFPGTQKLAIMLFRATQKASDRLLLNDDDINELSKWEKTGWNESIDSLRGNFYDRDNFYSKETVVVGNGLTRNVAGRGLQIGSEDFPYIVDRKIAFMLTKRMMKEFGIPTFGFNIVTNRDAAYCFPGQIITVTDPVKMLFGLRVNVLEVRRGLLEENSVTLLVKQSDYLDNERIEDDLDDLPAPPPSTIDTIARPPQNPWSRDVPFYFMRARGFYQDPYLWDQTYGLPMVLVTPANAGQASYSAKLVEYPDIVEPVDMNVISKVPYPSFGYLSANINQFDGLTTGIIAEVRISNETSTDMDFVTEVQAPDAGTRFIVINDEFCTYEYGEEDGDEIILHNVYRGLVDTAPMFHAEGDVVYIITNNFSNISNRPIPHGLLSHYSPGFNIEGYNAGGAPSGNPIFWRQGFFFAQFRGLAPPRPHDTRIDGVRSGAGYAVGDTAHITWKTRFRKQDTLSLMSDPAERGDYDHDGPDYQTHYVMIKDSFNAIYICPEAVTPQFTPENELDIEIPNMANGPAMLAVVSEFKENGSMFQDWIPIGDITGGIEYGWNKAWNKAWNEVT